MSAAETTDFKIHPHAQHQKLVRAAGVWFFMRMTSPTAIFKPDSSFPLGLLPHINALYYTILFPVLKDVFPSET